MFTILLHSSKTMRVHIGATTPYQSPQLLAQAEELANYLHSLSPKQIASAMQVSAKMADKTHELLQAWSTEPAQQLPAIDAFLGDIYSGLQVQTFSQSDRAYANDHLRILSGLYGALKALDSIAPYRLEMGYKLTKEPYRNLYKFWGTSIANTLPADRIIINLSAVEYTKAVLPYLPASTVISPKFMTCNAAGEPIFVTVHAKVARGAFAHWLIQNRIEGVAELKQYSDLNYRYDPALSTSTVPVFVAKTFGGFGLSVRLIDKT